MPLANGSMPMIRLPWPRDGLRNHQLAAAEADLDLDVSDRRCKQRAEIGGSRPRQIDGKARQQRVEKFGLPLAQLVSLAPAKEGPRAVKLQIHQPYGRASSAVHVISAGISKTRKAGTGMT